MTQATTATTDYAERLVEAVGHEFDCLRAGFMVRSSENEWDGRDFDCLDGRVVRLTPVDGEWENGANIYLLGPAPARILQRQAQVDPVPARSLAKFASVLFRAE